MMTMKMTIRDDENEMPAYTILPMTKTNEPIPSFVNLLSCSFLCHCQMELEGEENLVFAPVKTVVLFYEK